MTNFVLFDVHALFHVLLPSLFHVNLAEGLFPFFVFQFCALMKLMAYVFVHGAELQLLLFHLLCLDELTRRVLVITLELLGIPRVKGLDKFIETLNKFKLPCFLALHCYQGYY